LRHAAAGAEDGLDFRRIMVASRTNWTAVAFGLALSYLAAYQLFKLPPVLPVLLESYGYDRTLAGGFMSVYAVAGLSLSVVLGRMVERHGPARPALAALVVMMLGNGLALLWPAQGLLVLAARALEGVAFAILAIAGPTLVNRAASRRHLPLAIALTATWIPVGQLTASLLAPPALALHGWQALWLAAMAMSLLLSLWTLRLQAGGGTALGPRAAGADAPVRAPRLSARERLGLLLAAAIFMLWSGQFFAYMTWLPQYLVEGFGLSVDQALAGYILPVAVLLVFNLVAGAVLRAGVPLAPLMAAAIALQAAVWWLHPAITGFWPGLAALVAYGIGAGITPTCLFAMPSAIAGPERAAPAFGIIMTGRNLGVLVGPILLAQAFELAGSWHVSAPIFGCITTLAAVLALLPVRRRSLAAN
jgi:MFS family permease